MLAEIAGNGERYNAKKLAVRGCARVRDQISLVSLPRETPMNHFKLSSTTPMMR